MKVGEVLPELIVDAVSEEHILQMALALRDPNPIHFDLEAVASAGLGDRLVNQGGTTLAYVLNLVSQVAGGRANVRGISCRFKANVVAGEAVTVGGEVTSVQDVDGGQLVECSVWAECRGAKAIEGTATFHRPSSVGDGPKEAGQR